MFAETGQDIETCLQELNNSLEILVPTLDEFSTISTNTETKDQNSVKDVSGDTSGDDEEPSGKEMLRQHGIVANDFDMVVTVSRAETLVKETAENKAVIESAKDQCKLLVRRWLPRIIRWSEAISRYGGAFSQKKIDDV